VAAETAVRVGDVEREWEREWAIGFGFGSGADESGMIHACYAPIVTSVRSMQQPSGTDQNGQFVDCDVNFGLSAT
jgi:hypothetical protein